MSLTIGNLPNEVLVLFFSNLNIKDLGRAAQVSKRWNEVSSCDAVWRHIQAVEDQPILSDIKASTQVYFQKTIDPVLNKLNELPKELPKCMLCSECRDETMWKKYASNAHRDCYIDANLKVIDNDLKMMQLFSLIARTFHIYIRLSSLGLEKFISRAEELAKKSQPSFHSPYPFLVLADEYSRRGNHLKAQEMREMAQRA